MLTTPSAASPEAPPPSPADARRALRAAGIAAVALAVAFAATTRVTLTGRWYGLYLLAQASGRPLELKDDLRLGDGPRLILAVSFSEVRNALAREGARRPRLELDWDAKDGAGILTNFLADGSELQTLFGRYVDDDGKSPQGLFVGGAIPEVAASLQQNQSGMALRDARGWHHVWCNVNEVLLDVASGKYVAPGAWSFRGSRILVEAPDRVVLQSEHEAELVGGPLRMERFAYFKAGRPFFRLGINLINVGDQPIKLSYSYGDEPWVGEFGSAAGNVGWAESGAVPRVAGIDPRAVRWGGILDTKSGVANFLDWTGATPPDLVYFGNHAGTPLAAELGEPLTSNEVFIAAEWRDRTIAPGETLGLQLTIGLAGRRPDGAPTAPEGAVIPR